jgi:hypothetical protein
VLATACASSTVPFEPTLKQEVAAQTQVESETREFTGSRIKRTIDPDNPNKSTLSPVTQMGSEELSRHRTIEDALRPLLNMRGGKGGG